MIFCWCRAENLEDSACLTRMSFRWISFDIWSSSSLTNCMWSLCTHSGHQGLVQGYDCLAYYTICIDSKFEENWESDRSRGFLWGFTLPGRETFKEERKCIQDNNRPHLLDSGIPLNCTSPSISGKHHTRERWPFITAAKLMLPGIQKKCGNPWRVSESAKISKWFFFQSTKKSLAKKCIKRVVVWTVDAPDILPPPCHFAAPLLHRCCRCAARRWIACIFGTYPLALGIYAG